MRTLAILLRKEMLATFGSPIAYTVAAVFLLVLGYTFSLTLFATKVANLLYIFHQMYVLTILLVPALTMRAIAEERRTDTLELLLTAPVGEVWIVLAKFLSVLALVLAMYAGFEVTKVPYDFVMRRDPPRHRRADNLGESCGHATARQDADAGVRVGEHRPLRRHEEVAAQRHLQPAGERRAVDRADDRRAHVGDRGDAALRPEILEVLQAVALRLLEVHPGAERRIGPGQHHRPHRVVGVGLGQCGVRRPDQVAAQRVPCLGSVQRQQPDRAVVGDQNERFGHAGPLAQELVRGVRQVQ